MSRTSAIGLVVLGAAVGLGVLGDLLLRATPWGLNVPVFVAILLAVGYGLARWMGVPLTGGGRWMVLPALSFAGAFAWRDSPTLLAANALALGAAGALLVTRSRAGRVRAAGLLDYVHAAIWAGLHTTAGLVPVALQDVAWRELPGGRATRTAVAVGCGVLIAAPLVLLFGALFAAADAVFGGLVGDALRWVVENLLARVFLIALYAWTIGGLLRRVLLADEPAVRAPTGARLGALELGVALGLIDALFLAFVLVQLRYLFGGADLVAVSPDLTYAEYARRGFFELVAVAALALPLLLLADWLLRAGSPAGRRAFVVLAGGLALLLFVVMASAVQRMLLYVQEYGLTELRLYPTAFMGWLALVLAWFAATALRGRRGPFAFGALAAGFAVVALLDALNPDDFIVRTNAARASAGQRFDADYATFLSADAVPALVGALPLMSPPEQRSIARYVLERWPPDGPPTGRTWNWSRSLARSVVAAAEAPLRELAR